MPASPQHLGFFESQLPPGDFLIPKQLAAASGWSTDSIKAAYDEGKIFGNQAALSSKKGSKARGHIRVPRHFAALFLASLANHSPEDVAYVLEGIFRRLPRATQHQLMQNLAK